ncbi:hypothetical protein [Sulfitobacter pacificus]|uniref:hypothetical protein n=1 Tax=Sulfitobacter pacificus TaxID=1499314 RepID=UPI0031037DDF
MDITQLMGFAAFEGEIRDQIKKKILEIEKSESKTITRVNNADLPDEDIVYIDFDTYKERVKKYSSSYSELVRTNKGFDWRNWLEELVDCKDIEYNKICAGFLESSYENIRAGGRDNLAYKRAVAIHYRLHADLDHAKSYAYEIDKFLFKSSFPDRGKMIFEKTQISVTPAPNSASPRIVPSGPLPGAAEGRAHVNRQKIAIGLLFILAVFLVALGTSYYHLKPGENLTGRIQLGVWLLFKGDDPSEGDQRSMEPLGAGYRYGSNQRIELTFQTPKEVGPYQLGLYQIVSASGHALLVRDVDLRNGSENRVELGTLSSTVEPGFETLGLVIRNCNRWCQTISPLPKETVLKFQLPPISSRSILELKDNGPWKIKFHMFEE